MALKTSNKNRKKIVCERFKANERSYEAKD